MANTFIFDDDEQPDMGSPAPDQDDEQAPEEGEGNNRTFILLLIGIGGFALVAILCIAGYFFLSRAGGPLARPDTGATAAAETQLAIFSQETQSALASPTLEPTPTFTETPTATSVVVFATETPLAVDPVTATFEAMQTQVSGNLLTATAQAAVTGTTTIAAGVGTRTATSTARIPNTGFADEVGLPGLVIVTIILLAVILLARRLRATPAR